MKFPPAGISNNFSIVYHYDNFKHFLYCWCKKEWVRDIRPIELLYHHCQDTLQTHDQHHSLSQHQRVSLTTLAASILLQHPEEKTQICPLPHTQSVPWLKIKKKNWCMRIWFPVFCLQKLIDYISCSRKKLYICIKI